jgi:CheY-like chemotaxis protein
MRKLIIVDDDWALLESLKWALQDEYDILTAESGEECLKLLNNKADIILTDYHMRGMNGLQLLEKLTRYPRPPAVILFSAHLTYELIQKAISLGVRRCMLKPFDLEDLKKELRQISL